MEFDWDRSKADANLRKHGVSFPFATLVFLDEQRIERLDASRNYGEDRFVTIGLAQGIEIAVVYTRDRKRPE